MSPPDASAAHPSARPHGSWPWRIVAAAVGLLGVFAFTRDFWLSGFTRFHSDLGDGRFTALVASHWADPRQFAGGWTDLGFFHPVTNALGYSDTMLAFGVVAAPLQWLGIGIMPAFQWSIIVFLLAGYAAMIGFLRRGPQAPWPLAILGAVLWNFSNALFLGSSHPQLIAFCLIPVVLLTALRTVRASRVASRLLWAVVTGMGFGLITTTAFYIGWFALVGGAIAAALWAVLALLTSSLRIRWRSLGVGLLGALLGAACIAPVFIATYAPVLRAETERPIEVILEFLLRPAELVNVSATNLVWGQAVTSVLPDLRVGEFMMAPTLGLLAAAVVALVVGLVRVRRLQPWSLLGLATLITGFLLWLAPVDFGSFQPWRWLFALPGASAIRAVGRIEILAAGLLALGLVLLMVQWWRSASSPRIARTVMILVAVLLVVEQVNLEPPQKIEAVRIAAVEQVPAPPAGCRSFVLVPPFDEDDPWFVTQIDAMWIARVTGVPTWNGYTGFWPPNWQLFVESPDYMRAVRAWKTIYRFRDACGYNLMTRTWLSPAELSMLIDRSVGWGKP